jgi:hypothetical protein
MISGFAIFNNTLAISQNSGDYPPEIILPLGITMACVFFLPMIIGLWWPDTRKIKAWRNERKARRERKEYEKKRDSDFFLVIEKMKEDEK